MDKFKNKYRISSTRLQNWDYASNGAYFITICTKNREHYFGEIKNKEMQLTETGKLAETYWMEIPEHFPFVTLGNFVIMPNHMHGILIIDKSASDDKAKTRLVKTRLITYSKQIKNTQQKDCFLIPRRNDQTNPSLRMKQSGMK